MKMSDKDFDQLFSSKLADMEMEPSANVWNNITSELDGKKDKKAGIPFMRIAATIIVIMGVGLFFLRPEHVVTNLHGQAVTIEPVTSASTNTPATQSQSVTNEPVIEEPANSVEAVVKHRTGVETSSATIAKIGSSVKSPIDTVGRSQNVITVPNQTTVNTSTQVIAVTQQPVTQTPDAKGSNLPVKANGLEPVKNQNPIIAANPVTKTTEQVKRKRGIHSLGDLLNVVIAKVDKREDKLIEFTNNSDDDSFNVTGVNLGLVHAKREN